MIRRAGLAIALVLSGCGLFASRKPVVQTPAHYTLGTGYQMGGAWYYPKDQAEYAATGLAAVTPDHAGPTADGEQFDGAGLAGAHHTLQLPAIARVTNLENGRQLLLRLNDRGPVGPGRLIGLTRHAANLLGAADGTQVRVELEPEMTRLLLEGVAGSPKLAVATAPRAAVAAESLAPPPGFGQSGRGRSAAAASPAVAGSAGPAVAATLPDRVDQTAPSPGQMVLRASDFGRVDYANQVAARLSGLNAVVERVPDGRALRFRVRAGPFATVAAADAALDQARRAGVSDARLVVEQERPE